MKRTGIDLYFFTGTGNTLLVAEKMAEVFQKNGRTVTLKRIETSNPRSIDPGHTLGLAFPVAAFSTFTLVWDFVHALPDAAGTEAFMVDTLGGLSGGIVGPMKKALARKGFVPIGAGEIPMPSNVFYVAGDRANAARVERGLRLAERYAAALLDGTAAWPRVPVLPDIVCSLSAAARASWNNTISQKLFMYRIARQACKRCGLCCRLCPTKNITMREYPVHGYRCQYCMRCISFCPAHAVTAWFQWNNRTYSALDATELL